MENRHAVARPALPLLALALIALALLPQPLHAAPADGRLEVTYVYNKQCLSCQRAWPVIERALDQSGVPFSLAQHEITTREGAAYARASGVTSVPAVVINCGPPLTPEDYDSFDSFDRALRERIACEAGKVPCGGLASHACDTAGRAEDLSVPAALVAGLIAGINPCLLAVMAFIAGTTLSAAGRSIDILARTVSFCGGLLAVYMLIGAGLIGLMGLVPGLDLLLKGAVVATLAALAAWSLFDAYRVKRGFESRSFRAVLDRFGRSYGRMALPASFGIGAAFGLVKMPCVGGLYIAILGTILQSDRVAEGIVYLVAYNFGVVAPVLALGGLMAFGLSPAAVNEFRLRHRVQLKLFTGLLLAGMALSFAIGLL